MDAETWLVVITAAGVMVSAGLSIRGQVLAERHNRALAERAEAAAGLQADHAQQVITALQELASKDFGGATVPEVQPLGVRWSLTHHTGDTYMLENTGDESAEQVIVAGHESLIGPTHVNVGDTLNPGEALTFMAARSLATSDSTINIGWVGPDGSRHEWKYPLPSRPPR